MASEMFWFFYLICFLQSTLIWATDVEYDGPIQVKFFCGFPDSDPQVWEECCSTKIFDYNSIPRTSVIMSPTYDKIKGSLKKSLQVQDSLFTVKAAVKGPGGEESSYFTSTRASCYSDCLDKIPNNFNIYIGSSGEVLGLNMPPCGECSHNSPQIIKSIFPGPTPDTASYIQKLEKERDAKERGAQQDNRSFLAKYWVYILPLVLFVLISGGSSDPGNGQGGGGNFAGGSSGAPGGIVQNR